MIEGKISNSWNKFLAKERVKGMGESNDYEFGEIRINGIFYLK